MLFRSRIADVSAALNKLGYATLGLVVDIHRRRRGDVVAFKTAAHPIVGSKGQVVSRGSLVDITEQNVITVIRLVGRGGVQKLHTRWRGWTDQDRCIADVTILEKFAGHGTCVTFACKLPGGPKLGGILQINGQTSNERSHIDRAREIGRAHV